MLEFASFLKAESIPLYCIPQLIYLLDSFLSPFGSCNAAMNINVHLCDPDFGYFEHIYLWSGIAGSNSNWFSFFWGTTWSPVVKTQHIHCRDTGSIPGRGTKIPQAARHAQKNKMKMKLESDLWSFCQGEIKVCTTLPSPLSFHEPPTEESENVDTPVLFFHMKLQEIYLLPCRRQWGYTEKMTCNQIAIEIR